MQYGFSGLKSNSKMLGMVELWNFQSSFVQYLFWSIEQADPRVGAVCSTLNENLESIAFIPQEN